MSTYTAEQLETLVQERLTQAEQDKQKAINEAVLVVQQEADSRLSEVVASKDKELAELRGSGGQVDISARIAEAVQVREAELKQIHEQEVKAAAEAAYKRFKQPSNEKILAAGIKHGEKLFNERWEKFKEEQAAGVQPETIAKAIEEATKKKEEEHAEKLEKAKEGAKNEADIKNKLTIGKLQRQFNEAKVRLDFYERQYGPIPGGAPQASPQQQQRPQQLKLPPQPHLHNLPIQPEVTFPPTGGPPGQVTNTLQKLQAGRGGGIPRGRGGGNIQGRGGGGLGRSQQQRLAGQHPSPQQPQQNQGQRPAVNRPVPAGSPTAGVGQQQQQQQRHQPALQQLQSQLPRPPGGLNVAAPAFQPNMKRVRDDEGQGGQANQDVGHKRTRVANNNAESTGNDEQT